MTTYRTERAVPDRAGERLDRFVERITQRGYRVTEREPGRARLVYEAGSLLGGSLARSGHRLLVTATERALSFAFRADLVLTLADDDASTLESRVDAAMDPTPAAAPVASAQVIERQVLVARCKFCRAISPIGAPTCGSCGAADHV